MSFKKIVLLLLLAALVFTIGACKKKEPEPLVLDLFAPEEALAPVLGVVELYRSVDPDIAVRVTLDDGTMIAEKLLSGYTCDIIIDFTEIMDQIDGSKEADLNPQGYSCIDSESRTDVFKGPGDPDSGEEGSVVYSIALAKNSKHAEEAQALADFFVSERCNVIYEECDFSGIE